VWIGGGTKEATYDRGEAERVREEIYGVAFFITSKNRGKYE
jgi:hypothetical protein